MSCPSANRFFIYGGHYWKYKWYYFYQKVNVSAYSFVKNGCGERRYVNNFKASVSLYYDGGHVGRSESRTKAIGQSVNLNKNYKEYGWKVRKVCGASSNHSYYNGPKVSARSGCGR